MSESLPDLLLLFLYVRCFCCLGFMETGGCLEGGWKDRCSCGFGFPFGFLGFIFFSKSLPDLLLLFLYSWSWSWS
jgi:hypothetical protein